MANKIVFTTHPESSSAINDLRLSQSCLPYHRRKRIAEYEGRWGRKFKNYYEPDEEGYWKRYYQPLVYWFLFLIKSIEADLWAFDIRNLSWEFAYYIYVQQGDPDNDEFAFRCSQPIWFITIRDPRGEIIHKNWTFAIDEEGDLQIKRGPATHEDPMANAMYIHDKTYERFYEIVRTYGQLESWAKNKNKAS